MAAAYQWGYRGAMIVAGAVPLFLATSYNWNISYGVMAALMLIGVAAVLVAPRERQHIVRPIPTGDLPKRPVVGAVEWAIRLAIVAVAALVIGTGLTGSAGLLASIFPFDGNSSTRRSTQAAAPACCCSSGSCWPGWGCWRSPPGLSRGIAPAPEPTSRAPTAFPWPTSSAASEDSRGGSWR
jgi:hypothetical protein